MTTLNPPCHTDHESGFSALALVENAIGVSLLSDAYWRAANYLSVGQIYLLDNPLLREP